MTEQEAEAWAARLTRIWVPKEYIDTIRSSYFDKRQCPRFKARISPDIQLDFGEAQYPAQSGHRYILYRMQSCEEIREAPTITGRLAYENTRLWKDSPDSSGGSPAKTILVQKYAEFAAEWLPFFRRSCWLSGENVEATAHEKAKWMQGFSAEELEAWNLKM